MAAAGVAATFLASSMAGTPERSRFVRIDASVREPADWVAEGAGGAAHGAGNRVFVGSRSLEVDFAIVDAAFVGRRLFLAGADRRIHAVRLEPAGDTSEVVPLSPAPTGPLHLTAMESWLVVAEDDAGLRFVPVAGVHACHPNHRARGFLPLEQNFQALAASKRTVYAALASGGLLEIDANDPAHPFVRRSIPHAVAILAMAASSSRLYLLGDRGLEVIDLTPTGVSRSEFHEEVTGRSIELAGRVLRIAGGERGVATYRDVSSASQIFDVSVNDDYFTPHEVIVALGDTVRWSNATGDLHNVVSCTPDQIGCEGSTATESFTSGPATGFWSLDHTFSAAGSNPYLCQPHAGFMSGIVTVEGSAGAPPGVPDGSVGSPMRVTKLSSDGSTLSIAWDTATCSGAADHEILYGYGFGLPGSTGSGYELSGARCAVGATSPFTWNGAPPSFPGSTGFVFWLVVATDAAATEGSWGRDGAGLERTGPGAGGASGECGIAVKSLTNSCPP